MAEKNLLVMGNYTESFSIQYYLDIISIVVRTISRMPSNTFLPLFVISKLWSLKLFFAEQLTRDAWKNVAEGRQLLDDLIKGKFRFCVKKFVNPQCARIRNLISSFLFAR